MKATMTGRVKNALVRALVASAALTPARAYAAPSDEGAAVPAPSASAPSASAPKLPWKRWALFDPYLDPRARGITLGLLSRQAVDGSPREQGVRIGLAQSTTTTRGALLTRLSVEESLRVAESGHVVLGLRGYDYGAGVTVGRFSLEGRIGLRLLELHLGPNGFGKGSFNIGFGGLTPSTSISISVPVGPYRVALMAVSEYAYRWLSSLPAERLTGITLGVFGASIPPGLPEHYELSR